MLTSIRTTFSRGIARWILIFLMSVLIVSFGIWGIQDVFRGFGSTEVASVGSSKISIDTYQRAFNQELRQLSQRAGRTLTPTEARALGLDRQVLAQIINSAALDEQARRYGLGLSNDKIAAIVQDDPNFKDANGQFDARVLGQILRQSGLSEAGFLSEQQRVYLRDQINEAVAGDVKPPKAMQEAVARYGAEERGISYLTLTDAQAGDIPQPDQAQLQSYFDEHKGDFRAPEFRKFTYIAVTPEDLAGKATVSDQDVQAQYDSRKDLYTTPEKRTLQQIAFPNPTEAKAAADRIASGQASFDTIAQERNVKGPDLELGTVTRAGLLDPAVADAAFKLPEGGVSGVVNGKLSTVILRVTKIEPEGVTPFDQVKDKIKQDLALDRAKRDLMDLQTKVEDDRAGGATLKEVAQKYGLKANEIAAMDAQGRDAAGQPYTLPQQQKLSQAVFTSEVGADTDMIDGHDAGVVWYSVDGITPARDRTLDEARGDVAAAWTTEEKAKRLKAKADEALKALQQGKSIDDEAKELGVEAKQAWNLKRNGDTQGLSAAAVNLVFATPVKGHATALSGSGTDRIVFEVTDSTVPPFDPTSPQSQQMAAQLGQLVAQDLLAEYIGRLQNDLGTSINQTNVNRAIGAGTEG